VVSSVESSQSRETCGEILHSVSLLLLDE